MLRIRRYSTSWAWSRSCKSLQRTLLFLFTNLVADTGTFGFCAFVSVRSLAMILIYTLNLTSYTNPTPASSATQRDLPTRFHLVLDPSSPHIELLPTSNSPTSTAAPSNNKGKGKKDAGNDKGSGAGSNSLAETYVVKRGWLGGWSVSPAQQEQGWTGQLKKRVQRWVMGWSSEQKAAAIAV